ncbi:MAG: gamma carbonic anhydrase family protein [Methylococcales bacterium]
MAIRTFQGFTPKLGQLVYIDESAVVIGDVKVADDVSIWPGAVVRGDVHSIKIGAGTNVQDGCVLHVTHDGEFSDGGFQLKIGKGVTIGHRAVVHGCTIGDQCLIGIGAVIMDGAVIQDNVMVGAGCLVPPGKQLVSGYLYLGTPARQIRPLTASELEHLRYSFEHYVTLKDQYLRKT